LQVLSGGIYINKSL